MSDPEAQATFPNTDQRLAFCHNTWRSRNGEQAKESMHGTTTMTEHLLITLGPTRAESVRSETFLERSFLVVPAVLVRSQVLHNNLGASFLPANEITDEWAGMWNGIPVLVGDHPNGEDGQAATGRVPEQWDARVVGWIFHARAEQESPGVRRLAAEVWLDEVRAEVVDGFQLILDQVRAGQTVELSTGFAAQLEPVEGVFMGEQYEIVMHPLGADHLVISSEFTGACGVRDGCGLGANSEENAMAEDKTAKNGDGEASGVKKILRRLTELFEAPTPAQCTDWWEQNAIRHFSRELTAWNLQNPTDQERMQFIRDSLQSQFGAADRDVIVADVYSEAQQVVFWVQTPLGPQPSGSEFFLATFEENDNGFTFGEPSKVRRMVRYEPVGNAAGAVPADDAGNTNPPKEDEAMADQEKNAAPGTDVAAQLAALTETVSKLAETVGQLQDGAKADPNPAIAGLKKTIAQMAERLEGMEGVTSAAVKERERERQHLVQELAGNFRVPFSEVELEGKPIEELRKLAEMSRTDYAGRGGPSGGSPSAESRFMEPVPYTKKGEK